MGERDHSGGDRGRRAPRGAPRRALRVPRVARRAEAARLGHRQDPELGQVRLADEQEAGIAKAAHEEGVVLGHEVAEQVGCQRVRHSGHRRGVLDRDRHAGERARVVGLDRVRRRERAVGIEMEEGVQLGLERLDPLERRFHQLPRGQLPVAYEAGELAGGSEHELGHEDASLAGWGESRGG
jgi:hypothetical protein